MVTEKKYRFSFTAASLRTKDLVAVAGYNDPVDKKQLELIIGNGKSATGIRLLRELKNRLNTLTKQEIKVLKTGSFKAQNEIAFLAACKYFRFIREFVIEVIREKYLIFDYELSEGDYLSFFRRKAETEDELEELSNLTQEKVKQVTFKILEQAGIIDSVKTRIIQPQIIEIETQEAIMNDNIEWLKVFLLSDLDIHRLKEAYE